MGEADVMIMKSILLFLLLIFPMSINAQILKERRVYYIDCSYSMEQNDIWNLVREKLIEAIDGVNDETTEILVCPYAFDTKSSVKSYRELATESGKAKLKNIINGLPMTKATKTYHEMPIRDFYNNRVAADRINYVFFMTDGISDHVAEDHNYDPFPSELKTWKNRYKDKYVYGFYVMLHPIAKSYKAALAEIGSESTQRTNHLWAVETTDVNINLVRVDTKAVFNARTEKYFEIPVYGNYKGKSFDAKFPDNSGFKVKSANIKDGKLRVDVDVTGDVHALPAEQKIPLQLTMNGGGQFDFLVTETVTVSCLSKPERTLKISIR